jgi:hypothetical protein
VLLDLLIPSLGDAVSEDRESRTAHMIAARRNGTLAATVDRLYPDESAALRAWTVETWSAMALGVVDELDSEWMRFAPGIECRTALIHGDVSLGGGGDLPADWLDDPWVRRVAGAGHYLHATHAREVAALVTEFVESL